jgi:hypothetical protein
MRKTIDAMNDPLDDLLAAPATPVETATLRHAILLRSTALLRRRRRLKQLGLAASLAACFLGGMATMRCLTPAAPKEHVEVAVTPPEPKKETPAPAVLSAAAVENAALDSTDRRDELYRLAAELYRKEGDLASWIRCKDNALEAAKKDDLAVSPDDDFLTIALKQDRQKKEKRDARHLD